MKETNKKIKDEQRQQEDKVDIKKKEISYMKQQYDELKKKLRKEENSL